ncbi:MAG: N-acetylmuramoyl-L-alanine amidase, partial [Elusimicrobia bacterium]|nr:N-acetylmuramoyl-L-alanine amidase [Elusimicrobiota bacterium]
MGGIPFLQEEGIPYVFLSDVELVFRGTLHWFQVSGKVRLAIGQHWVDFFPGEQVVSVDDVRRPLDHPLTEIDGKIAVPLEFLSSPAFTQAVEYGVVWDGSAKTLQLASLESQKGTVQVPLPLPPAADPERAKRVEEEAGVRGKAAGSSPLPQGHRIHRIVVDAGHGGHDPGAVGYRRTKEKDINLLFARELTRILRERGRYEVYLTREDDTFVPLADRALFANERQADLFLSIHCN